MDMDEVDHYDFINAPQYVDFVEIANNGFADDDADKFFETHREEDDFFMPQDIDTINPTVHLLNEQNVLYEANNTSRNSSQDGTQSPSPYYDELIEDDPSTPDHEHEGVKKDTSNNSFHTPLGGIDDKENCTPRLSSVKRSCKQNSKAKVALENNFKWMEIENKDEQGYSSVQKSLVAELDKLSFPTDDENATCEREPTVAEVNFTVDKVDDTRVEQNSDEYTASDSTLKNDFLCDESSILPPEAEPFSPVGDILVEETIVDESNVRRSIMISPNVGQEIVWGSPISSSKAQVPVLSHTHSSETQNATILSNTMSTTATTSEEHNLESLDDFDFDDTIAAIKQTVDDLRALTLTTASSRPLRRVSSCSELHKVHMQKKSHYGFVSKVGITIPKTPDTMKRMKPKSVRTNSAQAVTMNLKSKLSQLESKPRVPISSEIKAPRNKLPSTTTQMTFASTAKVRATSSKPVPMKGNPNNYVSVAEAVAKFQNNTPDRFRSIPPRGRPPFKRASSVTRENEPKPKISAANVRGRSVSRERTNSTSSTNSTSRKIVQTQGPKCTVPQPFKFSTLRDRKTDKTKSETIVTSTGMSSTDRSMHSRMKNNQKENEAPKGSATARDTTTRRDKSASRSPTCSTYSARSRSGSCSSTSGPKSPSSSCSYISTFEQRYQIAQWKKEQKIKQERLQESKMREFHANPLPNFTCKLPKKKPAKVTAVQPFHLQSDERAAAYRQAWEKKREEEERKNMEKTKFHANPVPSGILKKGFEPDKKKHQMELVEPINFQLNTEKRAVERERFDQFLKQKEEEAEERRRQEAEAREREEKRIIAEMRKYTIHKAQPFKKPKAFEVKYSEKPLTEPVTPQCVRRQRPPIFPQTPSTSF